MRKNDPMDSQQHRDPRHDPLFDALRADMATLDTPPAVEQALLQAFAQQFPQPAPRRRWYQALSPRDWVLGGGLAGVALALVAVGVTLPRMLQAPALDLPAAAVRPLLVRADDGAPFIALDSAERIENEPAPRMVETEVPRSSLVALGLPLTPDNAGDAVKAELLVASDGQALALRLPDVANAPGDGWIAN
jgi:hypothetical protein